MAESKQGIDNSLFGRSGIWKSLSWALPNYKMHNPTAGPWWGEPRWDQVDKKVSGPALGVGGKRLWGQTALEPRQ
jgi:hypothetical protein